jgi:Fur family transcriptional regulator, ferric uptake regulator
MKSSSKRRARVDSSHQDWKASVRQGAGRVTRSREEILELLRQHQRPWTPQDLLGALPPRRCDLATVYRTLTRFEELGLVQRVDLGDGRARFEIAENQPGGHHHHHLVCRDCSQILEIDDCIPADLESRVARQHGFRNVTHRLEFFGICPRCQRGT